MYNTSLLTIFSLEHFIDSSILKLDVFYHRTHNLIYSGLNSYSLKSFKAFIIVKSFLIIKYLTQQHENEFLILIAYICIHKHLLPFQLPKLTNY